MIGSWKQTRKGFSPYLKTLSPGGLAPAWCSGSSYASALPRRTFLVLSLSSWLGGLGSRGEGKAGLALELPLV